MTTDETKAAPDTSEAPAGEGRREPIRHDVDPDRSPVAAGLGGDSAPRRTLLAAERTYLAWLRTGLGAIAVSVAVGRLAPALVGGSNLAYALLGAGYGVLGVFLILYALIRARRLEGALDADAPVTLDWWALAVSTAIGLVLAIATIAMVLVEA